MTTDYINDFLIEPIGHGGRREGSGRKSAGYVPPPEKVDLGKAQARNEAAKASLNELDFRVKSRQYLSREAYQQASATAVASFAQTMRGLPDMLENQGVPADVCVKISDSIDNALSELADELAAFLGPEPEDV